MVWGSNVRLNQKDSYDAPEFEAPPVIPTISLQHMVLALLPILFPPKGHGSQKYSLP